MANGGVRDNPKARAAWVRRLVAAFGALLIIGVVAEVALRLAGIADFPLYRRDQVLSYIPAPNQKGAFLNKQRWVFNDASMGVARSFRPRRTDIVLLGDSIVMGGNSIDQGSRIGPQIEELTGCRVWPLGASSWSLVTEMRALRLNPRLMLPQTIIVLSNSEDLVEASRYASELSTPTRRPFSILLYSIRKKLRISSFGMQPRLSEEWKEAVGRFTSEYRGRVIWAFYPSTRELRKPVRAFERIADILPPHVARFRIDEDPGWGPSHYQDSLHPTEIGSRAVANIIAQHVQPCNRPSL